MIWGTRSRMHHPSWFQFPSWCRLIFFFWHLVFFTFPSSNTFSWDHSLRFDYLSDWLWTSFSSSLTDPVSSFLASSFFVLFRPWKWPQESGKQLLNCVVVFGHKHYFVAAFHCYFRETRNRISSHATHKAIREKKPLNSSEEGYQEFTSLTTFVFQTYKDSPVYLDGQQEIIERERDIPPEITDSADSCFSWETTTRRGNAVRISNFFSFYDSLDVTFTRVLNSSDYSTL